MAELTYRMPANLERINAHPRDAQISFLEGPHKYIIESDLQSTYVSVTTWVHNHFGKFDPDEVIRNMTTGAKWKEGHKYWGMNAEEIKAMWSENGKSASEAGTLLHARIEDFYNAPLDAATNANALAHYYGSTEDLEKDIQCREWGFFLEFVQDFLDLEAFRTEWRIYDEDLKIAGSIDMVFRNPDGSFSIYDWKRAKEITQNGYGKNSKTAALRHIPDSNYWHYALQLNLYKYILERKYDMRIQDLCLVRLHPDASGATYERIVLPDLTKEIRSIFSPQPQSSVRYTEACLL